VAAERTLDLELAHLHARALLAIVRSNDGIDPEESVRLVAQIEARSGRPVELADLLLLEPLEPAELAARADVHSGPFRGSGVHPSELAALIVADAIAVVIGKGHLSEEEGRELLRFAVALGCSVEDVRSMSVHLQPFLAALEEGISFDGARPRGSLRGGRRGGRAAHRRRPRGSRRARARA
jgi:hypothetical protein